MNIRRNGLWLLAALTLLGAPPALREVRGQEAADPVVPAPAKAAEPVNEAAKKPPAPPPDADVAEPPAADAGDNEEKVSADNNLSFPVDI